MQIKSLIKLKSFSTTPLENSIKKLILLINSFEDTKISIVKRKTKKYKFTLLKSPHVHKKAREQFEECTFKRSILFETSNIQTEKILKGIKELSLKNVTYNISFIKKSLD